MELKQLLEKSLELFDAKDTKELTERIKSAVENNDFDLYLRFEEMVCDLSQDWLQMIFQYYEADRKEKMQDYTPKSLAKFAGRLCGDSETVIDMCAGSGALTIQKWNLNPETKFILYEFDEKVIPFLLFNMAIRNIECIVFHSDVLQQEIFNIWKVSKGEKYSTVQQVESADVYKKSHLVSNPPYNMKWRHPEYARMQSRFSNYELPPESNANYAFILSAMDISEKATFILPTGVLSTANKQEQTIRRQLVENNLIESIILCPGNMFELTSIATCLVTLNKRKDTALIEIIDMRKRCDTEIREQNGQFGGASHTNRTYQKQINVFSDEQIEDAITCIEQKKNAPMYCRAVTIEDVKRNDYILTPSRYIEFDANKSIHRDYKDVVSDINRVIREKNSCKLTINETLAKRLGFDLDLFRQSDNKEFNQLIEAISSERILKDDYFRTTKNKNEVKFENNNKDDVSSIFMMIFNTWKQHIYYLNNEENRYLAELRDALLPDLMSGKIEIAE